jgi:hypothetical protein
MLAAIMAKMDDKNKKLAQPTKERGNLEKEVQVSSILLLSG